MPDAISRDDARLLRVLALLTFATGLVDAASVLGLGHVFTANMTGNVVFLGFSLAGAGRVAISDSIGGVSFRTALALEAVLMASAAAIAWATHDLPSTHLPEIALMASGMGIQNASVRKLGVSDRKSVV